jgi:hypothetical protein
MSNNAAFLNFLNQANTGNGRGLIPVMKDYQHADRLYINSDYSRAPKVGFLYFVDLNINEQAVQNKAWAGDGRADVGLLAKKADLPKFSIDNETLNQYNRKTVVQKGIKYNPINIEFHDDNTDITHNLWVNYYKNYYADSLVGRGNPSFKDTKYGDIDYIYGRFDNGRSNDFPFLYEINLYVLHQRQFTQYTLVNPKITEWQHDSIDQSSGNKIMQNKMTIAYESVVYSAGQITKEGNPVGFAVNYYDNEDSPIYKKSPAVDVIYDEQNPSPFDQQGIRGAIFGQPPTNKSSTFDQRRGNRQYGTIRPQGPGMLQQLGTILAKNYINQSGLTRQKSVGYNIAGSVMGQIGSGPGKYASPPNTEEQPGVFTLPGGVGINIFKGFNTTVDGSIRANPAAILFPPKG